jgi:ubiquinone/menaquinone biosynthesis C-methylase UbiE
MTIKFDQSYLRSAAERPSIQRVKTRSYELMKLQPGGVSLDIGCGPGVDTIAIGKLVGPEGKVIGVDHDPDMVKAADIEAENAGVSKWTSHQVASCINLPFTNEEFDSCRCERVLQHLSVQEGAYTFDESLRVIRAGGHLVHIDTDWASLSIHSRYPTIERRITGVFINKWRNGYAARGLLELFRTRGMQDIIVECFAIQLESKELDFLLGDAAERALSLGIILPTEWSLWRDNKYRATTEGWFHASVTMVICAGKKSLQ